MRSGWATATQRTGGEKIFVKKIVENGKIVVYTAAYLSESERAVRNFERVLANTCALHLKKRFC